MLKVLELFAGIGACSEALTSLGIEHEIVDAVEIDKYAVESFNAVHGTDFEPQDITKWDKDIECDLIMHGSPCQDFSVAGKGAGGDEGSGTRSSLLYETLRIVEKLRPKYVIWENVKNLLSKKHVHNWEAYAKRMEEMGYTNYCQVLNAKDYGVPQNRERAFTVSIRTDVPYSWAFEFPEPFPLAKRLKDILEDDVDEKYYVSTRQLTGMATTNYESYKLSKLLKDKDATADTLKARFEGCPQLVSTGGTELQRKVCDEALKKGVVKPNDVVLPGAYGRNFGSKEKIQDPDKEVSTLQAAMGEGGGNVPLVPTTYRIRKLTPKECWRLMGFSDESFEKAEKVNSNTQLYKQAGNSIVVDVLEAIFKELFNA